MVKDEDSCLLQSVPFVYSAKAQLVMKNVDISEPQLPCRRKLPRRYGTRSAKWEFAVLPKAHNCQMSYELLDMLIVNCINN